jgi:hypothetical protein
VPIWTRTWAPTPKLAMEMPFSVVAEDRAAFDGPTIHVYSFYALCSVRLLQYPAMQVIDRVYVKTLMTLEGYSHAPRAEYSSKRYLSANKE